jgi:cytoskeletal protein RodZ
LSTTLSVSLKKPLVRLLVAVVVVTLSIAVLVALPGIAQAQQTPVVSTEADQNTDRNTDSATTAPSRPAASESPERLTVYPGDSFWSISQRYLGPQASPQQIANEAERIFELNRDRTGEDPSLLMPGEELLLAPSASEQATDQPANEPENSPAATAVEPAAQPPVAASESSEPAAETASGASLDIPAELEAYLLNQRKLIGLGVVVLTLALAILILWKLPMRRNVGTEAWGISAMASYQTPRRIPTNEVSDGLTVASSQSQKSSRGSTSKPSANGRFASHANLASIKPVRRKPSFVSQSPLSRRRKSRNGWATGVHNPQVRLALKRMPRIKSHKVAAPIQELSYTGK